MDQNTSSPNRPGSPGQVPAGLEQLAADIAKLAGCDPDELPDALACEQLLAMRRLLEQAEGYWLRLLAHVDGTGAAGAEQGLQAPSTAGWLRATTRMAPGVASQRVRTARALHHGPHPLTHTAHALASGEVSYQHAAVLADATRDLPPTTLAEAEPVLVDAAHQWRPRPHGHPPPGA